MLHSLMPFRSILSGTRACLQARDAAGGAAGGRRTVGASGMMLRAEAVRIGVAAVGGPA
jgi:hypothetical protein